MKKSMSKRVAAAALALLMAVLGSACALAAEEKAPAETAAPDMAADPALWAELIESISPPKDPDSYMPEDRFLLYDCDADGQSELLAITCADAMYTFCDVYGLDEEGQPTRLFTNDGGVLAGGPVFQFVEMELEGERYLAYRFSNFDGGTYGSYLMLAPAEDGSLEGVHELAWDQRGAADEFSEPESYTLDGEVIALDEAETILASVTVLADQYATYADEPIDKAMTPAEFLAGVGE